MAQQDINQVYSPVGYREAVAGSQDAPTVVTEGVEVKEFGEVGIQVGAFSGVATASLKVYVWKTPKTGAGFWSLAESYTDVYVSGEGWAKNFNGHPWERVYTRLTIDAGSAAVIISVA